MNRFKLSTFFSAATLLWLFLLSTSPALANSISYIYIEASEGNSSGGHTALQIADNVFHFQYADTGIIRLEKHPVADFEFLYRFLDNRTLHISRIDVSDETHSILLNHFNFQYQVQKQQIKQHGDFLKDRILLKQLLHKPSQQAPELLRLEGAGLFYDNAEFTTTGHSHPNNSVATSNTLKELRYATQDRYGAAFFTRRQQQLNQKILQLQPPTWDTENISLTPDNFPPIVYSFADNYVDLVTELLAIKAIAQSRDLVPDAYFIPVQEEFSLSSEEIATLQKFRLQLTNSLINLMQSKRPDRGYALLVNSARLITVTKSIQTGRLVLLDTFATNETGATAVKLPKYIAEINTHIAETRNALLAAKSKLKNNNLREQDYSRLEMLGNHYTELHRVLKGKPAIRLNGANLLPVKSIQLPNLTIPKISEQQLHYSLHQLDQYAEHFEEELKRLYAYNLLTRNCVTELFRAIDAAFIKQQTAIPEKLHLLAIQEADQRLGGHIAMAPINFIPFTSHYAVQKHFNVATTQEFPSFRLEQLQRLYNNEPDLLVFFRENNTLSSTLYKHNEHDSFFIFFTDNTVLLRPFYGLFNTLASLGQSLYGLLNWPFDSGTALHSGLSGILMSLPEMAFVNMRKGSYQYLPFSQLDWSEATLTRGHAE